MVGHRRSSALKQVFDRVTAAVLLMLLSPLLVLIAAILLLFHGFPILFRQRRPGLHGRPFTIFKFRTMRQGDGLADSDEQRLTRLGRFLRATSLDELPELFNVVRGDMSLVGPRPLLMEYLPRYTPEQMRRHDVRPGITGWAQIHGRNAIGWEDRFAYDLWYVDHWTFWLDLRILGRTILTVLSREGIHAAGHATMPEFLGSPPTLPGTPPYRSWHGTIRQSLLISRRVALVAITLQLTAAACVALVDPYDVTRLARIDGINDDKTRRLEAGGRVERSLRLWLADYDTLILGGSRSWAGINPASPLLRGQRAYNAAVPEATMVEIAAIGHFALAQGDPPKRVFISLSLSMFEADRVTARDFEKSGFDGDPMALVYARTLVEPEALRDALLTIRDNLRDMPASDMANGVHLRRDSPMNYRQAFDEVLARDYLIKPWHYARFEYDTRRIALLRRLIADLAQSGTEVYVFTAPIHARQLEAMAAMGIYPIYERWLNDIAGAVAQVNADPATLHPVIAWDFTGYNSVTVEDIPDPGDKRQQMKWYWNSSLHTPALGDLLLSRMQGCECGHPDFGTPLVSARLPAILKQKQLARARYAEANPHEIAEIARLINETKSVRQWMVQALDGTRTP